MKHALETPDAFVDCYELVPKLMDQFGRELQRESAWPTRSSVRCSDCPRFLTHGETGETPVSLAYGFNGGL